MKALTFTIDHAQAVLLEELLSTAITAAAEGAFNEDFDSAERCAQRVRCVNATAMHDALDAVARHEVFGW